MPSKAKNPLRINRTVSWTAPTEAIAQNLERVLQNWPREAETATTDLGDLTSYNAGRQLLKDRLEQLRSEYDALEPLVKDAGTPAQKGALARLKQDIHDVNELLRKSQRPEPGGV